MKPRGPGTKTGPFFHLAASEGVIWFTDWYRFGILHPLTNTHINTTEAYLS